MNKKQIYFGIIAVSLLSILLGILGMALKIGVNKQTVFDFIGEDKMPNIIVRQAFIIIALGLLAIIGGVISIAVSLKKIKTNDESMTPIYILSVVTIAILVMSAISLGFNREHLDNPKWIFKQLFKGTLK